jgi:hypothetical protein
MDDSLASGPLASRRQLKQAHVTAQVGDGERLPIRREFKPTGTPGSIP